MDLPDRQEVNRVARRWKIDGYETADIEQEIYLCLCDPEGDHDIDLHLRRLYRRETRRKPKLHKTSYDFDLNELPGREAASSIGEDIPCAALMIAVQSECETQEQHRLVKLLADGASYADVCQDLRCNQGAARSRVSRLRADLHPKLYPLQGDR